MSSSVNNESVGSDDSSSRLIGIKTAYASGDVQSSVQLHQSRCMHEERFNLEIRMHGSMANKAVVFGGAHGCITAAFSLAALSKLGRTPEAASAIRTFYLFVAPATSLSLGYVIYSSMTNDTKLRNLEIAREKWESENNLEGEINEMVGIYESRGLSRVDAEAVTRILSKKRDLFIDAMMTDELGYSCIPPPSTRKVLLSGSLPAAASFLVCAVVPHVVPLVLSRGGSATTINETSTLQHQTTIGLVLCAAQLAAIASMKAKLLLGAYADSRAIRESVGEMFGFSVVATGGFFGALARAVVVGA